MRSEDALRRKIVEIHRDLHRLGFAVANDGNTSVKVGKNRFLITPKGLDKTKLRPADIVAMDGLGEKLSGKHEPSSEKWLHLMSYQARPDVSAIIHTHAPFSIALSLAGISMEEPVLPEVVIAFGKIPTAPYALTGTKDLARIVSQKLASADGVILERHGVMTIASRLDEAFERLERVEHTAKILVYAKLLGGYSTLSPEQAAALAKLTNPKA